MLTIYRRHKKSCAHYGKGRRYKGDCGCPIWVQGFLGEQKLRESLDLADWQAAQRRVRDWEAEGMPAAETGDVSIEAAEKEFLAVRETRKNKKQTIDRYRFIFNDLDRFATKERVRFFKQLDAAALNRFVATWNKNSAVTILKKLQRVREFFKFAHKRGYTKRDLAVELEDPIVRPSPTLPFSRDDMFAILEATAKKIREADPAAKHKVLRLRALVLLLRYAGLRISDAVGCEVDRLQEGKLSLYTAKTGQHVYVPLPAFVAKELEATPRLSDRHWFWARTGSLETARKKWSEALARLFEDAKIKDGHPHRFRDTMAVELLLAGTPIERVSMLLGHSSVRITEKHYNPWNRARQEQAEADVARAWASDPIVLLETKDASGTRPS
jgi:integrase/recombinase XerD